MDSTDPRDIAAPIRLNAEGGLFTASMKIRRTDRRIVLSQKPRLWFRAAVCLWALVVLVTPFMVYSFLFGSTTTRLTCDRRTGTCAIDGRTKDVPPLADIARAELDHDFNRRDGTNWGIALVARDGTKHAIEDQRAISNRSVADYRAAVGTINAYLSAPARTTLDTSFTYTASLWEKIQSVLYLIFGVGVLLMMYAAWTKSAYIFEAGKVTLARRWFFTGTAETMTSDGIARIVDRPTPDGRLLQLHLNDTGVITIVQAGRSKAADLTPLGKELAAFLGKPMETLSE